MYHSTHTVYSISTNLQRGAIHLHLYQGGGLLQRPSWSSVPSSPRSDSGLASSAPGSRRGRRGHHQGNRPQRGKDRSDLGGEEERTPKRTDGGQSGEDRVKEVKKKKREREGLEIDLIDLIKSGLLITC